MTDETTLLPCPFCGGEAALVPTLDTTMREWFVTCGNLECSVLACRTKRYYTEAEAVAAWNNRATHGTLTAEQVRECVQVVYFEGYSDGSVNRGQHLEETDWHAIADELNARAERTCRDASVDSSTQFYCSLCECTVDIPLLWGEVNYCPTCGRKVERGDA